MTTSEWHALNMFTGEIGPAIEPPHKTRRSDAAFVALCKLCGYDGAVLTDSLRGALNKARGQIVKAEREADPDVTLDDIAELLDGFGAWFSTYRRERFNEICRRNVYPMECCKLWPEYRKSQNEHDDIAASWVRAIEANKR
jgi:hypothetical protein